MSLGGLASARPVLAVLFFVAAFSLAGFPPTSGFVGKLGLLQVTFSAGQWVVAGISVVVSLLTTMSMLRLWQYIFWGKPNLELTQRTNLAQPSARAMMLAPAVVLVALSLAIGIFAEPAISVVQTAANQAIDRAGYIAAVNPQPAPAPTPTPAPAVAQERHP